MKLHILFALCIGILVLKVHSAAIPVWEFLSGHEKRAFLYSLFDNQVEELCEKSNEINCNKELQKYGLNKLKSMSDEDLDKLDPYQRNAKSIIWDSIMNGHPMQRTTPSTISEEPPEFGSQSEGSAKVESVRVLPLRDFLLKMSASSLPHMRSAKDSKNKLFPQSIT